MRKIACPKCGSPADELHDGRCENCVKERNLASLPEIVEVTVCPRSPHFLTRGKWEDYDTIEDVATPAVEAEVKGFKVGDVSVSEGKVKFSLEGNVKGTEVAKKENHELVLKIKKYLCLNCVKFSSGYYVAIVQIRSSDEKKIIEGIQIVEDAAGIGLVTRREKVRGGIDLYISSKSPLVTIEKELKKISSTPREMKKSFSLVTKKDGNDVYRTTLMVRL